MPALALQSADDAYRLIPWEQEASKAQSPEAHQISERTSDVRSRVFKTNTYETAQIDAVKHFLELRSGYASLSSIMRKTGLSADDFQQLTRKTKKFKKSFIVTQQGDEVYRLNTPFGGILDLCKAFRHLNAMKF